MLPRLPDLHSEQLIKLRYCEKATKFEKSHTFFLLGKFITMWEIFSKLFDLLRISELYLISKDRLESALISVFNKSVIFPFMYIN